MSTKIGSVPLKTSYTGARMPSEESDCLRSVTVVSANGLKAALITVAFSLSSNPRPAMSRDSVITAESPSSSLRIRCTVSSCRFTKSIDVWTPTTAMLNSFRARKSVATCRISSSSIGAISLPLSVGQISQISIL